MSIVSKPATQAYSKGWDRAFGKVKWGVMAVRPKLFAKDKVDMSLVGKWVESAPGKVFLLGTRREAREWAKWRTTAILDPVKGNPWIYQAKKYPR